MKKLSADIVVFATPIYSRAFELGADVVVYSTTKHVDGQGRCLGGSTVVNSAIMYALPDWVRQRWSSEFGLTWATTDGFERSFQPGQFRPVVRVE